MAGSARRLSAGCQPGSARRIAGLRCAFKSVLHWENDADELAVAPRAEDQHDKPGRFARDMREASNWRAHRFRGMITQRHEGLATHVPGMLGITGGKTSAR